MNEKCRLCETPAEFFYQDTQKYFRCPECDAVFTAFEDLPDSSSEVERYEMHTTQIDEGYRKFVSPISTNVMKDFQKNAQGLDFGAGRSQIVTKVLQERNYTIQPYDPFFLNKPELLEQKYNYITSCEVVEHFYHPKKEFTLLRSMLDKNGKLYLMTELYDDLIDFEKWYYKNDPTHVFLYTQKTFEWIKEKFDFKSLEFEKRLVVLSR